MAAVRPLRLEISWSALYWSKVSSWWAEWRLGLGLRFVEDCGPVPIRRTTNTLQELYQPGYWTDTIWIRSHLASTRTSIVLDWSGEVSANANDPYRIAENACYPTMLYPNADGRFALNADDPYYMNNRLVQYPGAYVYPPAQAVTAGLTPPTRKRSVELLVYPDDSVAYVVDASNSARPATPSEIAEGLGVDACLDAECTQEKAVGGEWGTG
ncbi:hypothetical protein BU26DRAFT_571023 [Trematosphaeria pertusa]|uniref:Uncharacterized protein n=1 Tax=Trematosphaeria pertusa TaxID=390896 RepID=A0A6A6HY94_9PLEO|nr:uncharacterized protein BU26DRAFT_571023 [Trematosphaeria pertusa]KAF2242340.1 hypothetical protein BU26DRAFT_571023 [Trematosphaeria pertusa]